MYRAFISTWSLFIGIAMIMLGNGLQGSLIGVRASLEGFTTATTGLIMTGYFVGFLAGSWYVPGWVRNVGHIRVFAALASLASVSVLIHAVFVVPWVWMAMRLITGLSYAGLYIVAESWLNEAATNENRGQLLSLYMIMTYGGVAMGQLFLNLSPPEGFELFVITSALISLALVPMTLSLIQAPALAAPRFMTPMQLYKASPLGVTSALGVGLCNGVWFGMGAVYASSTGFTIEQVSVFLLSAYVGAIVLQYPIGRLSDRFDRRLVLTGCSFIAAALAALAALVADPAAPLALYGVVTLFGGVMMSMYSLCIAHTNDYLDRDQMVAASGTLVMVGGSGAILGPVSASIAMEWLGNEGFFWWLMVVLTAIGSFALYRMTRRAAKPLDEQGHYLPDTFYSSAYSTEYVMEYAAEEQAAEQLASGEAATHPEQGSEAG